MPGNFFLERHADFKMPPELGGDGKAILIMGYNTAENVYTRDESTARDTAGLRRARSVAIPGPGPAPRTMAGRTFSRG